MNGLTVNEISSILNITVDAVRKRIETANIKPACKEYIYDKSIIAILKKVKMGRPSKKP